MRIFYGFAKWLPKKDDQKEGRMWQKSWNVFSQNYILIKAIFFFYICNVLITVNLIKFEFVVDHWNLN